MSAQINLEQNQIFQAPPRLYAALPGIRQASPAIAFWRHHPVADQNALTLAEATLRFHETIGGDLVKLTPAGTYQATCLGLEDAWQGDKLGRRAILHRPIREPSNWLGLSSAGIGPQEEINLEAIAWLRQRLPSGTPLLATIFSPLTQALQLAGAETLTRHAQEAPELVWAGVSCLERRTRALASHFRREGVDGLYYVTQHHVAGLLPVSMFSENYRAIDYGIMAASAGLPANILHLHGAPLRRELPLTPAGWAVHFEWGEENPDPRGMFDICRSPLSIGMPIHQLITADAPAECRDAVTGALQKCRQASALITAGCVLPLDFPLAQARRWVDAITGWEQ